MPESNYIKNGGLVSFVVKVNGNQIPDEAHILSISTLSGINRVPSATINILDGDASTGTFNASSSDTFIPGNKITIEAGYDTITKVIFSGIITGQSLKINNQIGPLLVVSCQDPAIKLTVGRKNSTYEYQKDNDVMASIISTYSGLSSQIKDTSIKWPKLVQYYATDWDFIISRAEVNGMIATTKNGKITIDDPSANSKPVLTITYGNNLYEFNANLDAISQLGNVKASSWDYKTQNLTSGESQNAYKGAGNLSSSQLAKVVGLSEFELQTSGTLDSNELSNWAKAQQVKSEFSKILGEVKIQGTELTEPGKYVTMAGVGDRFNGDYPISYVHHKIEDGNWMTEIGIGLSSEWLMDEPGVIAPSTSGLLPGTQGLYSGTVKKMYEDPDNQYRILVNVPLFDPEGTGIWARLSNFYSTNGAGVFFLPEVGDEVILGFLNQDPRYPIILGSLYSDPKNKPYKGLEPNEKNTKKAIVSKSGITIEFNDEDKIFTIETPDKNKMILSDKDKNLQIKDQNGNEIIMSSSGITIKSPKDINFESEQKVNISGSQGVNIFASGGDVSVRGLNIKQSADAQYSASGGATATVKAGAELSLKGGIIMIN